MSVEDYNRRLASAQAAVLAAKKPTKFNNVKVEFGGEVFDSKRELAYYQTLLLREKAGEVRGIVTKPTIELTPKFTLPNGEKIRASHMVPDFAFQEARNGIWVMCYVDVKFTERATPAAKKRLMMTPAYRLFNNNRKFLYSIQRIWIETA